MGILFRGCGNFSCYPLQVHPWSYRTPLGSHWEASAYVQAAGRIWWERPFGRRI